MKNFLAKVHLENGWNSKRMITKGEAAIPLETTQRAFLNQEKSKQRSAIVGENLKFFSLSITFIKD